MTYPCPVRIRAGGKLDGERGTAICEEGDYIRVKVVGYRWSMLFQPDEVELIQ